MNREQRKAAKKALLKKNRLHQNLFAHVRHIHQEQERIAGESEARKPKREPKHGEEHDEDKIWSAKIGSIRNRLTGKQRDSKERWNRFAGTSGGGGRGL